MNHYYSTLARYIGSLYNVLYTLLSTQFSHLVLNFVDY